MNRLETCKSRRTRSTRRSRGGLLIVAALVCLLVVTSIVAAMVHGALRARRALHVERDRRQAELLLEAGADRAIARLAIAPDFRGDTWEVDSAAILGQGDGRVTTKVSPKANAAELEVQVVAEYPLGREFPVRRSRTYSINSSRTQSQE